MSKFEKIVLLVSLLTDITILLDYIIPNIPGFSAVLGAVPLEARWFILGVSSTCILITVFLVRKKIKDASLSERVQSWSTRVQRADPNFCRLTVHYSRIKGAIDAPDSTHPRYVRNNRTKIAYRVADFLEPFVQEHKTNWFSHDSVKALQTFLSSHGTIEEEGDPLPEELGLRFDKNGSLVLAEDQMYSDLVSKLKDRNLEDLQVIYLHRLSLWHTVRRTLLLESSTNKAFLSPSWAYELVQIGLIASESKTMLPWESCAGWVKRVYGFTLVQWRYPKSKLTGGV